MSRAALSVKRDYKIASTLQRHVGEVLRITKECGLAPWSREDYVDDLQRDDSISFVAVIDERAVGFVIGRIVESAVKARSFDAELYNIGISEAFRKNGFGSALLKRFVKKCAKNKVKNIFLEVRLSNKHALKFYQKHGFEIVWKRKNFYSNPTEDAFVMTLTLQKFKG